MPEGIVRRIVVACLVSLLLLVILPVNTDGLRYGQGVWLSSVDASFKGSMANQYSGASLDIVGDINGDGLDDFVISTSIRTVSGTKWGNLWIFFGSSSGWSQDSTLFDADASLVGGDYDGQADITVSKAGDVNGDGLDDFIVGVPHNNENALEAGKVYLILGRTSGWTYRMNLSESNASFLGENEGDIAGSSVSDAGDVNGDGFDDFLIGAPANREIAYYSGKCYLILGRRTGWKNDVPLCDANSSFRGERAYSTLSKVANAGDVNGDNFDDFLLGAIQDSDKIANAGQAYLFLGGSTLWLANTSVEDADASFTGTAEWDYASQGLSGGGDLNGDGLDDIVVGSPGHYAHSYSGAGAAYIIFGRTSGWQMDTDLSSSNVTLLGTYSNENAGYRVRGVGDVNGDDIDDLVVASPFWGPIAGTPGRVFLILGKNTAWSQTMDLTDADSTFYGEALTQWPSPGLGLGGPGDVNGDGFDDLLIGAPRTSDNAGESYLIFPDLSIPLSSVKTLALFSNPAMTKGASFAFMNDTIYVKLTGIGGNTTRRDVTEVLVKSSASSERGFKLRLHETGVATLTFVGSFRLSNRTHPDYGWIGTSSGETVTVSSIVDPTKSVSLFVTARPILDKSQKTLAFVEDHGNLFTFRAIYGYAKDWTLHTNANWLQWNTTNRTIWGMPSNRDVGTWWADVNVSDGHGNADELNVTLTVANVPPIILTGDDFNATEDVPYSHDYASTDDGQGVITWHLSTDATWLSINSTSGLLSGTPDNEQVGRYHVNVSVDDGNGGMDSRNFFITVLNVDDPPTILTSEFPSATQDQFFSVNLTAMDVDYGDCDNLTWSVQGAPAWLHLDAHTGELSGTPTNGDVGESFLLVTVTDSGNLYDSLELILKVLNVDDPPEIPTADVTIATEDVAYRVLYTATDVDTGDVLTWSFSTNASWLSFVFSTRVLYGMPSNGDVGSYYVNLTVTDASGVKVYHNFTLTVLNANDLPQIDSSNPPTTAMVGKHYIYQVLASDVDTGDSLRYSLDPKPLGMSINETTGLVEWIPVAAQVGIHPVTVQVTDGIATVRQSFDISVSPAPENTRPSITSTPPSAELAPGGNMYYKVVATDPEDQASLRFSLLEAPPGMSVNATTGLITWTPAADQTGTHRVTVRVDDGRGGVKDQTFDVTVKPTGGGGDDGKRVGVPSPYLLPLALVLLLVFLVAGLIVVRRLAAAGGKGEPQAIDDVLLVYRDGRLIHHRSRQKRTDAGDLALASKLSTVQRFIAGTVGKGAGEEVNEVKFGKGKVLVDHGELVYLAVFIRGEGGEGLRARMREVVEEVELEQFRYLSRWDGDPSSLKGIGGYLDCLISDDRQPKPATSAPGPRPASEATVPSPPKDVVVDAARAPAPVEPELVTIKPPSQTSPVIRPQPPAPTAPQAPRPSTRPTPPPPPPRTQAPPAQAAPPPAEPSTTVAMGVAERAHAREHREVMKVLTQLPQGLPTTLWGWDMAELARAIVDGEAKRTPDGTPLVRVKGRWYVADRSNLGTFLREWDEGGADTPEERRRKLKQLEKALLDGKVSEQTYRELRKKYE
jgi:hypothetical protein